jgi:hypothetical protein
MITDDSTSVLDVLSESQAAAWRRGAALAEQLLKLVDDPAPNAALEGDDGSDG